MTMQSETLAQLAKALAAAQAAVKQPTKNREVTVASDKGRYRFTYATLDNIIECLRAPLTANGLWFTQRIMVNEGGHPRLLTTLLHSSGEWMAAEQAIISEGSGNQRFGSAVTYAKRYALASLFGIAADDDDDGEAADAPPNNNKGNKPAAPKPLPTPPKGEVPTNREPHEIRVNPNQSGDGSDWPDFGRRYIAAIKAEHDTERLVAWGIANAAALGLCKKMAPRVSASIEGAINKRRDELMAGRLPETLEGAIERGITP